ncbi:MAG: hypothetical protein H6716_17155 [Polyangiaceae bacterium]|nr:hypothetical protein [Polyangiaceae bacterium]
MREGAGPQYTALKREAASTKSATLGDLLKAKLGDKLAAMTGGEEAPAEEAKESDSEATE